MAPEYSYGVMSADRNWVSGLRPTPEKALQNFLWSRQKRNESDDWEHLQSDRGYRLVEFHMTPTQELVNGEWVSLVNDNDEDDNNDATDSEAAG